MTTRDQDRALERLSLEHDGAALQVQLADTPGAVLVTPLDATSAVYELDAAGHARLLARKRYSTGGPDCTCGYCQWCGYGAGEPRNCPGCGTLAYMGDNPGVCAACVHGSRATRDEHEQQNLFNAPRTMRGQIALGGIE